MKVYIEAPDTVSRSIFRVERALRRHAPRDLEFTSRMNDADLVVLHVIGWGSFDGVSIDFAGGQRMAVIQYCLQTTEDPNPAEWYRRIWSRSTCVWSYYDLERMLADSMSDAEGEFYHAPLGLDPTFQGGPIAFRRDIGVMTSGYLNHPAAEAIEEVALAAQAVGLRTVHLGPVPEGMPAEAMRGDWGNVHDITDTELADLYTRSRWVSGLRHVEGFELPALEGLACGARPILFDRPEMRQWYGNHAVYVPECSGRALTEKLIELFKFHQQRDESGDRSVEIAGGPVSENEQRLIRSVYDWRHVVAGFWERALKPMRNLRADDATRLEAGL
jgi:hypothetical protein